MSLRIPVTTQEPQQTRELRGEMRMRAANAPNAGGSGTLLLTVPLGHRWRIVAMQTRVQYDTGADTNQYVTYGMNAPQAVATGQRSYFSAWDCTYILPTTIYHLVAFAGADSNITDVISAVGVTERYKTRPLPEIWLEPDSQVYWGWNNFGAGDDGTFYIVYEEIAV